MFGFVPGPSLCCGRAAACYRAHFCGLCNVLRSEYGLWSRFLINRDSTLLALLGSSLLEEPLPTRERTCCNPLAQPKPLHQEGAVMQFVAAATMCGLAAKLQDDVADESGWRRLGSRWGTRLTDGAVGRALGLLHAQDFPVSTVLCALREDVGARGDLKLAGQGTATAYGLLFAHCGKLTGHGPSVMESLRRMGEALGLLIYSKDAWDDWRIDQVKGRFNPLSHLTSEAQRTREVQPLVMEQEKNLRAALEELPMKRHSVLIQSILGDGVSARVSEWFAGDDPEKKRKRAEKPGKSKVERQGRYRDWCDCCDCSSCCDLTSLCRSGRSVNCRGCKNNDCCDCNPCDGDGCGFCGCDC